VTGNGDHVRMNVTGMVCPHTGQSCFLELSHSDGDAFQEFLNHANADLSPERPRQILILDNASWHKRKSLDWGQFEALYLPPYSPDFNPIERLWLLIKPEWFTDFIAQDRPVLIARLDAALLWAINRQQQTNYLCHADINPERGYKRIFFLNAIKVKYNFDKLVANNDQFGRFR
jgi:transposase